MFDQESLENNVPDITIISFPVMEFLSNVIRKVRIQEAYWGSFQDKKRLKEFITTKPVLHGMLKALL